jgi:hypothetical protein
MRAAGRWLADAIQRDDRRLMAWRGIRGMEGARGDDVD